MKPISDFSVIEAMQKHGGSFVKHLAIAAYNADTANLNKIKATWPDYWVKYAKFAEEDARAEEAEGKG
jgi:hypothetical protein